MPLRKGVANALPTCKPCKEGDHGRCATVLGEAYLQVTDSTYVCRCYREDEKSHQTDADERQEDLAERRRDSVLNYGTSPQREYERWAEEL